MVMDLTSWGPRLSCIFKATQAPKQPPTEPNTLLQLCLSSSCPSQPVKVLAKAGYTRLPPLSHLPRPASRAHNRHPWSLITLKHTPLLSTLLYMGLPKPLLCVCLSPHLSGGCYSCPSACPLNVPFAVVHPLLSLKSSCKFKSCTSNCFPEHLPSSTRS